MNTRSGNFVFVLLCLFLDSISIGLSGPILPSLVEQLVGDVAVAATYFGALSTLYALMLFLFSPIQGALSDQFGRKPVLLCSLAGTGLSYVGLAIAPNLFWIAVAQLVNGMTGACLAVVFAYVADISTSETRSRSFGWVGVVMGIAWIIAPALGAILSLWGPRVPFIMAAVVTLLNLIYGLYQVPESHPVQHRRPFEGHCLNPFRSLKLLTQHRAIIYLAAVLFCTDLGLQCFVSTWVLGVAE